MNHSQEVEQEKESLCSQSSEDYSDVSEQYDPPYTVLITNLSIKTTENEICSLLGDPKIEAIEIVTLNKDKVACVTFGDLVSLKAGLLFDERMFNGRFIEISYCTLEDLIHYEMENGITLNKSIFYQKNGSNKGDSDLENDNQFGEEDVDDLLNDFDNKNSDSIRGKNPKSGQQKMVWKRKESKESEKQNDQSIRQQALCTSNDSYSPIIEAHHIDFPTLPTSSPNVHQKRGDTFRIIRQKSSQSSSGDLQNTQLQESYFKRESSKDSNGLNRSNCKSNSSYKRVDSPNQSPNIQHRSDSEFGKPRNSFQAQTNQRKNRDYKNRHYRKGSDNQGSNDRRYQNNNSDLFESKQKESTEHCDNNSTNYNLLTTSNKIPSTENETPTITDIEKIDIIAPRSTFVRGRGKANALLK